MTLNNRLSILLCVLALAGLQSAQAADVEVFGGYSMTKMKLQNDADKTTMNGWNTTVTAYPWHRVGLTADFAGYYGTASPTLAAAAGSPTSTGSVNTRQYSFMAGPQIRLFNTKYIETSVRAIFGGAYGYVPGNTLVPIDQSTFAALFGSNVDVKLTKRVAMRFSPGLYVTQYGTGQTQKNVRFSVGPVFKFGGES